MKARFNYTRRKKLERADVLISVQPGRPRSFEGTFRFEKYGLPHDARVFIQAQCGRTFKRVDYGTVQARPATPRVMLDGLAEGSLTFDVFVVRPEAVVPAEDALLVGRVLASGLGIPPIATDGSLAGRQEILPVSFTPELGAEVWRVAFHNEEPWLEVNPKFVSKDLVNGDASFLALVYPQAIRSVLTRLVLEEGLSAADAEGDRPSAGWLRFGEELARRPVPSSDSPDAEDQHVADKREWIEDVAKAFAERHALGSRFLAARGSKEVA